MSEHCSRLILATFGIAALLILARVPWRESDLLYEGRPLERWVNQLRGSDAGEAEIAISQIGPKAIPFLFKQVQHRPPVAVRHVPGPSSGERTPDPPLSGTPEAQFAYRVMCTVRLMGPRALPALVTALDDPAPGVRLQAVRAIGAISPDADVVLPVLTKLLEDPNWEVRDMAVTLLGRMRHRRTLVVPALLEALKAEASWPDRDGSQPVLAHIVAELGQIGAQAHGAVPELRVLLMRGADRKLQREAAIALCRIDGDTNALAFLLAELKATRDAQECLPILLGIHKMGPSARAAAAPILEFVSSSQHFQGPAGQDLQDAARQVLRRVDPEAAAKLVQAK